MRTGNRNDALGCDEVFSIRTRRFVQPKMARGTGSTIAKDHEALHGVRCGKRFRLEGKADSEPLETVYRI
jgi:hypothetical protein